MNLFDATNADRTVLITGAGGYIGSALVRSIIHSRAKLVVLLDHSEQNLYEIHSEVAAREGASSHASILGDVCDKALLYEIFERYRPQLIFHAAAFKHVPLMEVNPIAVIRNNVVGTWTLANASMHFGVGQVMMISTDKAANPRSIMGASKRIAEILLLRLGNAETRMNALRLVNVLGSSGSVVPLFQQQIQRGGPVTVTHPESLRYFLPLAETVDLILAAAALEGGTAVFIPELGHPVKILDLANRLICEAGSPGDAKIAVVYTGLRPGDKLAEDVISSTERLEPTADSRLRRVCGPQPVSTDVDSAMLLIGEGVHTRNLAGLVETILDLVPEYQPSESLRALVTANAL